MIYYSEKFNISLGDRGWQKYADAPEDPLNELSAFEMGIRRFCYELNRPVYLEIGEDLLQVFLDPDICMLLEDRFPEKIVDLEQNRSLTIDFVESERIKIQMVANRSIVNCSLIYFGDNARENSLKEKSINLDQDRVLMTLKLFLYQIVVMARDHGYITPEDTLEFLKPTLISGFQTRSIAAGIAGSRDIHNN